MTKIVMAYIGFLLLAMHFSSQVHAQNTTTKYPAMNGTTTAGGASSNMTKMPDVTTKHITIPKGASVSLQSSSVALLIPIVVAGSLLQGRF